MKNNIEILRAEKITTEEYKEVLGKDVKDVFNKYDPSELTSDVLYAAYLVPEFNRKVVIENQIALNKAKQFSQSERHEKLVAAYMQDVPTTFAMTAKRIDLTIESHTSFLDFARMDKRKAGDIKVFYFSRNKRIPSMEIRYLSSDGVIDTMQYNNIDDTFQSPQLIELSTPAIQLPTYSPVHPPEVFAQQWAKTMKTLRLSMQNKLNANIKKFLDDGLGIFTSDVVDFAPEVNQSLVPNTNSLLIPSNNKLTKNLLLTEQTHFDTLSDAEEVEPAHPRALNTHIVPLKAKNSIFEWVSTINSSNVLGQPGIPDNFDYAMNTVSPNLQYQLESKGLLVNLFGQVIRLKTDNTLLIGNKYTSSTLPAVEFDLLQGEIIPETWVETIKGKRFYFGKITKVVSIYQPPPYKMNYTYTDFT